MRRTCIALLSFAALAMSKTSTAFVPPPYNNSGEVRIAGHYYATGTNPDGQVSDGADTTLEKLATDVYALKETSTHGVYVAICARNRDVLACGWGPEGLALGVASYRVKGNALEGVWVESKLPLLGSETLTLANPPDVQGVLAILAATSATGTPYTGSLYSREVTPYALGFVWSLGGLGKSSARIGYALRLGDTINVGFNAAGSCGIVQYRIGGNGSVLTGTWIDAARPQAGLGVEILTRI